MTNRTGFLQLSLWLGGACNVKSFNTNTMTTPIPIFSNSNIVFAIPIISWRGTGRNGSDRHYISNYGGGTGGWFAMQSSGGQTLYIIQDNSLGIQGAGENAGFTGGGGIFACGMIGC